MKLSLNKIGSRAGICGLALMTVLSLSAGVGLTHANASRRHVRHYRVIKTKRAKKAAAAAKRHAKAKRQEHGAAVRIRYQYRMLRYHGFSRNQAIGVLTNAEEEDPSFKGNLIGLSNMRKGMRNNIVKQLKAIRGYKKAKNFHGSALEDAEAFSSQIEDRSVPVTIWTPMEKVINVLSNKKAGVARRAQAKAARQARAKAAKQQAAVKKNARKAYRLLRSKGFNRNQALAGTALAYKTSKGKMVLPAKAKKFMHSFLGKMVISHDVKKARHFHGSTKAIYNKLCKLVNVHDNNAQGTIKAASALV